jgi:hypothetical protein
MISLKFVNIACNVIKFIRLGGKLTNVDIYRKQYSLGGMSQIYCCPLGAVCFNAGLIFNRDLDDSWYKFAFDITKLTDNFFIGFDRFFRTQLSDISEKHEDFVIGYKLAEMCIKRKWVEIL